MYECNKKDKPMRTLIELLWEEVEAGTEHQATGSSKQQLTTTTTKSTIPTPTGKGKSN